MVGSRSAPPSATVRTAGASCSGGMSLSTKPLAPAWSARNTYSSGSKVVKMMTLTGQSACSRMTGIRSWSERIEGLAPDAWDLWLDPGVDDPELLRTVLHPWPDQKIAVDAVSRRVGSVANDDPGCIEPIVLDDARGEQLGLF